MFVFRCIHIICCVCVCILCIVLQLSVAHEWVRLQPQAYLDNLCHSYFIIIIVYYAKAAHHTKKT